MPFVPMAARVVALTLAFVMSGAPVLSITCQVVCATREIAGTGTPAHHCRHGGPPSDQVVSSRDTHPCDHSNSTEQVRAARPLKTLPVSVPVATNLTFRSALPDITQRFLVRIGTSPPGIVPLASQLRI